MGKKRRKKKNKKKEIKNTQLDLGMKPKGLPAILNLVTSRVHRWLSYFEVIRFTKDFWVWFFLTLSIANTVFQSYIYIQSINKLPRIIPIFTFYNRLDLKLINSELVILIPLLSLAITVVVFFQAFKNYHKEKDITYILLGITAISLTALSFHIFKLAGQFI